MTSGKPKHPYVGLPHYQFWKNETAIADSSSFDPITKVPFKISKYESVVTAGSCFAQHVARHLRNAGFNYLVTEEAHPMFSDDISRRHNYGIFSARYGNIYTARQLKQLLLRAYGEFFPENDVWKSQEGYVDAFRPQIQPNGFCSRDEVHLDREQHFKAIREAIEKMSVFVFTLGLTECWEDTRDGSIFPLAPGVAGGEYRPKEIQFKNFDLTETVGDLTYALEYIRAINPSVKIILTVSPVPLNATYEDKHVWVSTTLSKSVLRLAADEVVSKFDQSLYFPSYEIITSPYARGKYFLEDCRSVSESGVENVMKVFLSNLTDECALYNTHKEANIVDITTEIKSRIQSHHDFISKSLDALCDEEAISNEQ